MNRGKDDEKMMGPMFPRLHVNDTEKGGPRAPPRNKMALYEQLSIPSQRFNSGPLNPSNPAASSSLGSGHERGMPYQHQVPRSAHSAEKSYPGHSHFNTPLAQLEQKNRLDEEDFTVPTFVQSEIGQDRCQKSNGMEEETSPSSPGQDRCQKSNGMEEETSPSSPAYLSRSMNIQSTSDKEPKRTSITGVSLRQEGRSQNENPKEFMAFREQSVTYPKSSPGREKTDGPLKQTNTSVEQRHHLANNFSRLQRIGASLHPESRANLQLHNSRCENDVSNELVRGIENGHSPILRRDSCPEKVGSPRNTANYSGYLEDKIRGSSQMGNGDRIDIASETSMVDSLTGLDISPDDVVGIIGEKHFCKARRAIVSQQRVFAVQVFELHRLIKVQRSIAGSPNLLAEESAYLGKPLKGSPAKELPVEYIVKTSPHIVKHKVDSENPNHKMECSAENAVGKTFLSSAHNVNQPSNHGPFSGNPLIAPLVADTSRFSPCFHQPPEPQWLIPVMSPSEGLIYKPYTGHGFVGPPFCGGSGPPGPNPMMGSFINPQYGVPTSHHRYPGIGHGYFPPYGMPVVNPVMSGLAVEQSNSFSQQGSGGGVNFNVQHQSSCNVPTQKHGAFRNVVKPLVSKETEFQGSTASSPGERARGIGAEANENVLPLFPTSPAVNAPEGASSQLHDTEQPTRVIKVVPHNARSATASAARIFQSIQQERKQQDSV